MSKEKQTMLLRRTLLYCMFLPFAFGTFQINFHQTDVVSVNDNDVVLYHDCLKIVVSFENKFHPYQMISFCMSEWPSEWNIEKKYVR